MTNVSGPFFFVSSSVTNIQEKINKVPQTIPAFTVELIKAFLGRKMLLKTESFEKKAIFPLKETFWSILSRIIEYDKCQIQFLRFHNVFWHLLCKW